MVSIASVPTCLVPRSTPITVPLAACPKWPPTSAAPWIAPPATWPMASAAYPPTRPASLSVAESTVLTVSTVALATSTLPFAAPMTPFVPVSTSPGSLVVTTRLLSARSRLVFPASGGLKQLSLSDGQAPDSFWMLESRPLPSDLPEQSNDNDDHDRSQDGDENGGD